jgi:hypothetical protein
MLKALALGGIRTRAINRVWPNLELPNRNFFANLCGPLR